jgi:hypothetical protein
VKQTRCLDQIAHAFVPEHTRSHEHYGLTLRLLGGLEFIQVDTRPRHDDRPIARNQAEADEGVEVGLVFEDDPGPSASERQPVQRPGKSA